jgi:glycosyltransferase involved in cell wall biosynthesis
VIEAVRDLSAEAPIQLLIGGNGSDFERIKGWARGHSSVFLLGWLDAPQIHAVMSLSQVGLAPYKSGAAMSLPNKPFEYMAGRLAIVSSIEGELAQLLKEHESGLTYRSFDGETLKRHLNLLRHQPELARAMGEHGHQLFMNRFESNKVFARAAAHFKKFARIEKTSGAEPAQRHSDQIPVLPE